MNNTESVERARKVLKYPGLRITTQRALILEVIRGGGGHLDADEVYQLARKKQPRLSLSTVYRTLQTLKQLGLVEEVHFDETHHHYELKPSVEHHHLICLECGKIVEFKYPLARLIKKNIKEANDFEITESEIRMAGYCVTCRKKEK